MDTATPAMEYYLRYSKVRVYFDFMLDGVKMNVIQTAGTGVVDHRTIFEFMQKGEQVKASYAGGKIHQGFLVGSLKGHILSFTYCQARITGELDHGESICRVSRYAGKLRLEEKFEMSTGHEKEKGINLFQEI